MKYSNDQSDSQRLIKTQKSRFANLLKKSTHLKPTIRIGTRKSPLAQWQANHIADLLRDLDVDVEMIPIVTQGDVTSGPLGEGGGVGLFTKEIQRALLDSRCDIAVHSLKDLPTEPVEGLTLAGVPERHDPADVMLSRGSIPFPKLPHKAIIGTGSTRRKSQLLSLRADLDIRDIRGNLDTRIQKLENGEYDAIVLAAAGLERLGLHSNISYRFKSHEMLPAVGQAALGLETRLDDHVAIELVQQISHPTSQTCVLAERAMLSRLRGGCLAPVAALATLTDNSLTLQGRVLSANGDRCIQARRTAPPDNPVQLGHQVADDLLAMGARELIDDSRHG